MFWIDFKKLWNNIDQSIFFRNTQYSIFLPFHNDTVYIHLRVACGRRFRTWNSVPKRGITPFFTSLIFLEPEKYGFNFHQMTSTEKWFVGIKISSSILQKIENACWNFLIIYASFNNIFFFLVTKMSCQLKKFPYVQEIKLIDNILGNDFCIHEWHDYNFFPDEDLFWSFE